MYAESFITIVLILSLIISVALKVTNEEKQATDNNTLLAIATAKYNFSKNMLNTFRVKEFRLGCCRLLTMATVYRI